MISVSFRFLLFFTEKIHMDPSLSTAGSSYRVARLPFKGIHFLRATSKDDTSSRRKESKSKEFHFENSTKAGLVARDFYESVISTTPTSTRSPTQNKKGHLISEQSDPKLIKKNTPKPVSSQRQSERVQTRNKHQFLRSAQEGDVKAVESLLCEGSVDINDVDDFAWTALMCASYSGQRNVVSLLLRKGALWENNRNKSGQTALDLARRAGHLNIVGMLEGIESMGTSKGNQTEKQAKFAKSWCDICRLEYRKHESRRHQHKSSTVHQFNCQHKPTSTMYYIPESNVGFQLMMKEGWDKEKGLGRDGAGQKFPVKTILKRDRKGLGAADREDEASKARVTHFKPFDVQAVKRPRQREEKKVMKVNTLNKRQKKQSHKKEKDWERDFRQSFHLSL
ncbi:G patch domain and ankyrin repeat-containing protein 1 homolog [Asterias rubens]|uniref:G patch domain and ankyrin repeat-containing protein 1 homolog n=1 Tax=Asterias rubens TaxID=7604 RepID=UPI0014551633|nr:G patch domain and ankyrin repeat-containing protein 1 homolog [Asterias rubens]